MGTYKDTRRNGEPRKIIFSDHSLERVRQRLPKQHAYHHLHNGRLADCIETAVLAAIRCGRIRQGICPTDNEPQWDVDVRNEIGFRLIVVLKNKGADGNDLGDVRIVVTALVGSEKYYQRLSQIKVA